MVVDIKPRPARELVFLARADRLYLESAEKLFQQPLSPLSPLPQSCLGVSLKLLYLTKIRFDSQKCFV